MTGNSHNTNASKWQGREREGGRPRKDLVRGPVVHGHLPALHPHCLRPQPRARAQTLWLSQAPSPAQTPLLPAGSFSAPLPGSAEVQGCLLPRLGTPLPVHRTRAAPTGDLM
ncbi:5-Formyltetrahydrofolate Cyclo-Ligase [Manis pentadactyla]|nr:5-Formyltetrahydrofolate Cyclo-Ligase [Manis pentadactyla]